MTAFTSRLRSARRANWSRRIPVSARSSGGNTPSLWNCRLCPDSSPGVFRHALFRGSGFATDFRGGDPMDGAIGLMHSRPRFGPLLLNPVHGGGGEEPSAAGTASVVAEPLHRRPNDRSRRRTPSPSSRTRDANCTRFRPAIQVTPGLCPRILRSGRLTGHFRLPKIQFGAAGR